MALELDQVPSISVGDVEVAAVDYTDWLDSGELLTGTPTVTEVSGNEDLTFANEAVNTATKEILDRTVAIGKAVQFKVSGQTAGSYTVKVTVDTDSSPARTKVVKLRFDVES